MPGGGFLEMRVEAPFPAERAAGGGGPAGQSNRSVRSGQRIFSPGERAESSNTCSGRDPGHAWAPWAAPGGGLPSGYSRRHFLYPAASPWRGEIPCGAARFSRRLRPGEGR